MNEALASLLTMAILMHHADPSREYQSRRVVVMHGCGTGELLRHTALTRYAAFKGLVVIYFSCYPVNRDYVLLIIYLICFDFVMIYYNQDFVIICIYNAIQTADQAIFVTLLN